jgi:hypothetical protein
MNTQKTTKRNPPPYQSNSGSSQTTSDVRHQKRPAEKLQAYGTHHVSKPAQDIGSQLREYAKRKPDVAAMWC